MEWSDEFLTISLKESVPKSIF